MSRKVFTAGEVLAAADVNNFLMDQTVMSFAGTAARGSAIPSPVEGMVSYLEDINVMSLYDGSAWRTSLSPTGGILQVVSASKTDTFTMSSNSDALVTGLSVTITPKSTANKILVIMDVKTSANQANVSTPFVRIKRNGTNVYVGNAAGTRASVTGGPGASSLLTSVDQVAGIFLDAPASVSALTYTVNLASSQNGQAVNVNRSVNDDDNVVQPRTASSITVMEVAG